MLLETERLILRPLCSEDIDDLHEYHSHEEIVRYIPWPVRDKAAVELYLEKVLATNKESIAEEGDTVILGWQLKSSGKVIGQSNLTLTSALHRRAEFGYVTHQDYQRQGFALEASEKVISLAFESGLVHRVVARIDSRADASKSLAGKLGMRLEGTFIESEFFKGEWVTMHEFAITKAEFLSRQLGGGSPG